MPGARLASFRQGDRSELRVELLLSGLAFTTRVPRQEDVGIDFFCSLITGEEGLLKAGLCFTVQAKSSTADIVYEKPHEIEWITTQENPFFVCVAHHDQIAMDIYSTWNMMCCELAWGRPSRLILQPGTKPTNFPGVINNDGTHEVALGDPILHVTETDLSNETKQKEIGEVLRRWVSLDRINMVNRAAGMYWVTGPVTYTTGKSPDASGKVGIAFYWHPQNIPKCIENLGRAATALTLLFDNFTVDTATRTQSRIEALRSLVDAYWDGFDPSTKAFLQQKGLKP